MGKAAPLSAVERAADEAARAAYGKLLARIARRTGDIAAAEDALGEAFAKALATWPRTGVPSSPEAWLTTVARNALSDERRKAVTRQAAVPTLTVLAEEIGESVADERLGLILAASHPAIAPAVHAPLILQTVFGVTAQEMAPSFLVPAATMSQRLVRAKTKIKAAGIPFEVDPIDRAARIERALDAIYALYTVARAKPHEDAAPRVGDAVFLARLIASLAADNPEASGLAALIVFSEARRGAQRDAVGAFIPLSQQDTGLWDTAMIEEAEQHLARAAACGRPGPYQIEAAIQSVHCDRAKTGRTNWTAIAVFYDALVAMAPSVGAKVAKAAARAEVDGPAAGLALLEAIPQEVADAYQPYWAVRAHLERRMGQTAEGAFAKAIDLAVDASIKRYLATQRDCDEA
ncbi:MAG: DUF6596 domain-containing protein [Devosia sp.]